MRLLGKSGQRRGGGPLQWTGLHMACPFYPSTLHPHLGLPTMDGTRVLLGYVRLKELTSSREGSIVSRKVLFEFEETHLSSRFEREP